MYSTWNDIKVSEFFSDLDDSGEWFADEPSLYKCSDEEKCKGKTVTGHGYQLDCLKCQKENKE